MRLCGFHVLLKCGRVLELKGGRRGFERGQVFVGFQPTESLGSSTMAAAVQRNTMAEFRHRFTLRQTRRTVAIMFSMELVHASERLSFAGRPRRLIVSISSSPSRMLEATAGASCSSLRARLRRGIGNARLACAGYGEPLKRSPAGKSARRFRSCVHRHRHSPASANFDRWRSGVLVVSE
jgi:hypothetical protein